MVAQKFAKEVLKPGVYVKGDRQIVVSDQDCRDYFASLSKLHENGLGVPLILEHTDPDKSRGEGTPEFMSEKADQLRRTVGRVNWGDTRNRINERGGIELLFEVADPDAASQLADGRIEFVSPQLTPYWQDGLGRGYRKLISHVALTHRPIQVDQHRGFVQFSESSVMLSELLAPVQLSISEIFEGADMAKANEILSETDIVSGAVKLAKSQKQSRQAFLSGLNQKISTQLASDDDEEAKKKKTPVAGESVKPAESVPDGIKEAADKLASEPAEDKPIPAPPEAKAEEPEEINPDMPKANGAEDRKQFDALIAHLSKAGFVLPSDTSLENIVPRLLAAAMTKNAAEEKKEPEDMGVPAQEMSPSNVSQMSDTDAHGERAKVAYRIRRLAERGILQPGIAEKLLPRVAVLQFSDVGVEIQQPDSPTMSQFLDAFEGGASLVHSLLKDETAGYQLSDSSAKGEEGLHPRGDDFLNGDGKNMPMQVGDPRAVKAAKDLLSRHGLSGKGNVHTSINGCSVLSG